MSMNEYKCSGRILNVSKFYKTLFNTRDAIFLIFNTKIELSITCIIQLKSHNVIKLVNILIFVQ